MHFKKAFIPILFTENLDYGAFKTNSAFNTPVTYYLGDDDTIVVYPEIVSGNPLSWHKVVRWFLYKPGALTGIINYGENELYFFFQDKFNNTDINPNPDNLLTVTNLMDKIYKQTNYNSRSGCCYILRKGKRRAKEIDLSESIIIDGKSHQEISKIFNTVERCISYDMETMYSFYAALCGCISIVVPEEGVTKEEWQPKKELRYGIAYGFSDDEINEAKRTRTLLLEYLKSEENCANESVKAFINKCEFFFSSYPPGNQIGANDTVRAKDGKDT